MTVSNLSIIKEALIIANYDITHETDESIVSTFYTNLNHLNYDDVQLVLKTLTINDAIKELEFLFELERDLEESE
tara:strand:+ start:152 stop:376 length:225 start_codon:yes stop_codon:yes gene_type:complete